MMQIAPTSAAVVEWVCTGVSLVFVLLRSYVRLAFFRSFATADYLVIFAWLFFLANTICDVYINRWGEWSNEIHFSKDALPDFEKVIKNKDDIVRILKLQYGQNLLYYLCLYFVKGAFLILFYKLFPPGLRKLRVALHISSLVTVTGLIVTLAINLLWCQPVRRNWTRVPAERCLAYSAVEPYLVTNAFHIWTDLTIYILPFFLLPTLSATATRRSVYILSAIFSLGALCILCTIARMVCVGMASALPLVGAWSAAEMGIAIIVACSPTLKTGWDVHRNVGYSHDDGDDPNGRLRSIGTTSRRDTLLTGGTITGLGKRSRRSRSHNADVELGSIANMVNNGDEALNSPGLQSPALEGYDRRFSTAGGEYGNIGIELGGLAPRKHSKPDVAPIDTSGSIQKEMGVVATEGAGRGVPPSNTSPSFTPKDPSIYQSVPVPASPAVSTNPAPSNSISRMMWKMKGANSSSHATEQQHAPEAPVKDTKKAKSKPKPKLKAAAFGMSTFGGAGEENQTDSATYSSTNGSRESRIGDDWGLEPHEQATSSTSSGIKRWSGTRSRSPFGS